MFKPFEIVLDVSKNSMNDMFEVSSNDLNTIRLDMKIKEGLYPFDLSGKIVRLAVQKPDKTVVFQTGGVTNAEEGLCEVILSRQANVVDGRHEAELMIFEGEEAVAVTTKFFYKVNKAILNDGVVKSSSDFPAISQAILAGQVLEGIDVEMVAEAGAKVEGIQAQVDQLVINGDSSVEAAQMRVDAEGVAHVTAKARADSDYNKVSAQLADIAHNPVLLGADRNGVNYSDNALTQINAVLNDGDKITFPKGNYKFQQNVIITKDVDIDFGGSTFTFDSQNGFVFNGALKTTKTVTVDYTEVTSKNSLTLNDVSDIAVGDLINVVSTELFKLTRIYYYKGGNAIVTKISGNVVYFNLVFPFDMTASSITVKIYKPIKANLKNINMLKNSNQQLVNTRSGIAINYGANCKVENVKTDNFTYNLDFYRCVNVDLSMITTGHAKNSEADPFDGYGIAIESCTNVTADFITTNSGQHGITTTGKEPVYNVTINKSTLKAETTNHSLGLHENIVNMTVNDSTLFGFWACGDVVFNNVTVLNSEISAADSQITVAQDPRYANYTFNNCSFAQKVAGRVQYQVYDASTYKMGKVIFNNCKNIVFSTLVKYYEFPKGNSVIGEFNHIEFKNCEGYRIMSGDKVKKLIVTDSDPIDLTEPTVIQKTYNSSIEKINEIYVTRSKFTNRYADVSILLADKVVFDSASYVNKTLGSGQGSWIFTNIGELTFINTDMTLAERGIETFTGVSKLTVINSKMRFRLASTLTNALLSVNNASIAGMTNLVSGVIENYDTATDGKKYKKEINASGVQTFTLVV